MEVLFDARDAVSSFRIWCLAIGLMALVAVLVGSRLRKPSALDEAFPLKMRNGLIAVVAVLLLCAAALPFGLALKTRLDFDAGRVVAVDGCAAAYDRVVHPSGHNVADTYVSVGGRALHFNSSPWFTGYRDAYATVREGQHLKAYMVGDRLARLERLSSGCTRG